VPRHRYLSIATVVMIISWNWLKELLPGLKDISVEEVERRLMMAGLNHEETKAVGEDFAIDLEVTSNRPDCLGHIGVAREASVLFDTPLALPNPQPAQSKTSCKDLTKVSIECPQLCDRYTARVIQGVKVGPSPKWMLERLATLGIAAINNVVDITNYVLMENGQPLHAFDFRKLGGQEIIVREAKPGEHFEAINHKTYELAPGMCVIADKTRPVALGGVMGGANTEVTATTVDVLIEAAEFDPISVRNTARKLALHSDSSYRFERGLDPEGVAWASRRTCELILQLAGGELAAGVVDVGRQPPTREPIVLRLPQLKRILGIEIPPAEVERILAALGNKPLKKSTQQIEVVPPSWRRDLTREIDLIEEVARIHGYDAIPEDVNVPMASSQRSHRDRVLGKVREALVAAGLDEAMTVSLVDEPASDAFSPWSSAPALSTATPILRRADRMRRSLVPSLLEARKNNEAVGNARIELFEVANLYLPRAKQLPQETLVLGISSGDDFLAVKGVVESIISRLNPTAALEIVDFKHDLFKPRRGAELRLNGERLGFLGELNPRALKQFELRSPATVAEIQISLLEKTASLVPQAVELSAFPAVSRDLNLVVDEAIRWHDLANTVRHAAGSELEAVEYRDTYRNPERLGASKKSQLFSIILRRKTGTLTSAEADKIRDEIVAACKKKHGAQLRA
jgi:phenylalanyl-tRNA synthetase beta chain